MWARDRASPRSVSSSATVRSRSPREAVFDAINSRSRHAAAFSVGRRYAQGAAQPSEDRLCRNVAAPRGGELYLEISAGGRRRRARRLLNLKGVGPWTAEIYSCALSTARRAGERRPRAAHRAHEVKRSTKAAPLSLNPSPIVASLEAGPRACCGSISCKTCGTNAAARDETYDELREEREDFDAVRAVKSGVPTPQKDAGEALRAVAEPRHLARGRVEANPLSAPLLSPDY